MCDLDELLDDDHDEIPRFIECRHCGGDHGWEVLTGYDPRDGQPTGYWVKCPTCDGTGGEEIEPDPVTLEDLEDQDDDGAAASIDHP